jgi:hypothetical protein
MAKAKQKRVRKAARRSALRRCVKWGRSRGRKVCRKFSTSSAKKKVPSKKRTKGARRYTPAFLAKEKAKRDRFVDPVTNEILWDKIEKDTGRRIPRADREEIDSEIRAVTLILRKNQRLAGFRWRR